MKNRLMLGYVFLGGAISWLLHLLVVYVIAEWLCVSHVLRQPIFGLPAVGILVFAISMALFAVASGAVIAGFRLRQQINRGEVILFGSGASFTVNAGIVSDLLFALVIIAQTLPIFTLARAC